MPQGIQKAWATPAIRHRIVEIESNFTVGELSAKRLPQDAQSLAKCASTCARPDAPLGRAGPGRTDPPACRPVAALLSQRAA